MSDIIGIRFPSETIKSLLDETNGNFIGLILRDFNSDTNSPPFKIFRFYLSHNHIDNPDSIPTFSYSDVTPSDSISSGLVASAISETDPNYNDLLPFILDENRKGFTLFSGKILEIICSYSETLNISMKAVEYGKLSYPHGISRFIDTEVRDKYFGLKIEGDMENRPPSVYTDDSGMASTRISIDETDDKFEHYLDNTTIPLNSRILGEVAFLRQLIRNTGGKITSEAREKIEELTSLLDPANATEDYINDLSRKINELINLISVEIPGTDIGNDCPPYWERIAKVPNEILLPYLSEINKNRLKRKLTLEQELIIYLLETLIPLDVNIKKIFEIVKQSLVLEFLLKKKLDTKVDINYIKELYEKINALKFSSIETYFANLQFAWVKFILEFYDK